MAAPTDNGFPGEPDAPAPLTFARWATGTLRRWRLLVVSGGLVAAAIVVVSLVLPPVYRAEGSFVSNTTGGVKLPQGLGSMMGLAGMASQLGMNLGNEPSESPTFYAQLVDSRELLTRLLLSEFPDPRPASAGDSVPLVAILTLGRNPSPERRLERGIERLRDAMRVEADVRTNLVKLSVDTPWPELSAAAVNRTMELVGRFNQEQRASRARSKREFVEERLRESERELRVIEDRHREFLLQNRQWRSSPTLVAEEGRLDRQMRLASDLALTLRREYESARIEEVNDAPVVTVVDAGVPPRRPRWPRPMPLVVLALFAGGLIGALAAGSATLLADWARRNPADAAELRGLLRRSPRRPGSAPAVATPSTPGRTTGTRAAALPLREAEPVSAADPTTVG